jgi:hypothetical protein
MLKLLAPGLLSVGCLSFAADLQFFTRQQRISAGDAATLEWKIPPPAKVALIGVGPVETSGTLNVSPVQTMSYTLVAESPSGLIAKSLTIEVGGSRGTDFPADDSQFRFPLSVERVVQSKAAFLDSVHRVLQNDLLFSVKTYSQKPSEVVFLTNSGERSDLVSPDERRLRSRRISYRVLIEDRPSRLYCTIDSLIEYQLRAEETWRKENREDLYRRKGSDLLGRITSIP